MRFRTACVFAFRVRVCVCPLLSVSLSFSSSRSRALLIRLRISLPLPSTSILCTIPYFAHLTLVLLLMTSYDGPSYPNDLRYGTSTTVTIALRIYDPFAPPMSYTRVFPACSCDALSPTTRPDRAVTKSIANMSGFSSRAVTARGLWKRHDCMRWYLWRAKPCEQDLKLALADAVN